MKRVWYRTGFKCFQTLLQGLLAGVLAVCLVNISYWMDGSFSFSELGKNFEESDVFLEQVEDTVHRKITYEQNKELFERDGAYDELLEVDIRQYAAGTRDEANINLNTAYYIRDLIAFFLDGEQEMEAAVEKAAQAGRTEQEIWELLDGDGQSLETLLPVSGSSLADYAELSANPSGVLLEYYQNLCATSTDVYLRYQEYETAQQEPEGSDNSEAPSNVRFYVENTNTKQRYTNLGVKSFPAAQRMIQNTEELDFLYVGERSFNIMVANSEYVMNDAAAQWFIGTRFLGSGEKVILAVDTSYPIGDELQEAWLAFEQREPLLLGSAITGAACIAALIILLALSIAAAGRREKGETVILNGFDRIPTEIAAGLCLIMAIIWYFLAVGLRRYFGYAVSARRITAAAAAMAEYWIFLFSILGLVRRIKAGTLWHNSVCYVLSVSFRQIYSAKRSSQRLLIAYLIFFALNIFFLRFFGAAGVIMAIVMDMAVLLYLMREMVGRQSIKEGLYQIAQGKLDYKINTKVMTGDSLEMAEAVNEMGDGLQEAVDAIIKNERLKAELITNVSHDIKTPLTSIINYVDLLKREELHNERAEGYIRVLEQKSQRLKQLTEDLIEASKINSGNVELHCMDIRLQQMLQQAYGEFAERLEEKNLEPVLRMEKEPVVIWADGRQLWRIFENLLGNIVKYAMPGTRVYLELNRKDQAAEVTFKNVTREKLEVSPEELQERFVRGDLSRNTEGSGLGLSIARSLTELMEGSFEVYLDGDFFQVTLLFPIHGT